MPHAPDPLAGFSPLVRQVVSLVGRRGDDPELLAFFAGLGAEVADSTTDAGGSKNVVAKRHGLEFVFNHDVKNEAYPLLTKTKKSFIPYLSLAWLTPRFKEPFPFGFAFGLEPDEVTRRLGVPPVEHVPKVPIWTRVLDAEREIVLSVDARECRIRVEEARELSARCGVPPLPVVGLFVAWAAQCNLLDAGRVGPHAALLEDVRTGRRKGSELLAAAWPRGLWDVHLADKPGLRQFAFGWFHNVGGSFINRDLIDVFGERMNRYSHKEPVLDDDDPAAVKKATQKLDAVFAPWLG